MYPSTVTDPVKFMVGMLWFDLLFDELEEDLYLALLAGTNYSLYFYLPGLTSMLFF